MHITVRLGDVAVFENRQTEPKLNKITNDEDKYKSSIVKVKPGLLLISEQKLRIYSLPRHIAKPPVRCRLSCRTEIDL
ncbi:MAG: hypothetical protein LC109_10060 [Bacteroidia bacterium]|nr:hypothetical protein [Bacteroidia bacterium]